MRRLRLVPIKLESVNNFQMSSVNCWFVYDLIFVYQSCCQNFFCFGVSLLNFSFFSFLSIDPLLLPPFLFTVPSFPFFSIFYLHSYFFSFPNLSIEDLGSVEAFLSGSGAEP